MSDDTTAPELSATDERTRRLEKVEAMRAAGVDPYPVRFDRTTDAAALRERFGQALPVIVITGSTMSGHEIEAHSEDFHLLVKPVIPTRLRALIAFKLGQR